MKKLNYILYASGLTGDSNILFFNTAKEATDKFTEITGKLLQICLTKNLAQNEAFDYYVTDNAYRFNAGYDEDLDAEIGDADAYYRLFTNVDVPDTTTHYVATFTEHVDGSYVDFFNMSDAITNYNKIVDDDINEANKHSNDFDIDRTDESTWSEDDTQYFSESIIVTTPHTFPFANAHKDAFFGYLDIFWTYRYGKIIMEEEPTVEPNQTIPEPIWVYIAINPKQDEQLFESDVITNLGVFTTYQKAEAAIIKVFKTMPDYVEDEMSAEQFIETHTLQ